MKHILRGRTGRRTGRTPVERRQRAHVDDPFTAVTPDHRLRLARDLEELSGDISRATSANAFSWITKGRVVGDLVGAADRVLDVGCGWGRTLAGLPGSVGVDVFLPFLLTARRYVGNEVLMAEATQLPFAAAAFDVVVMTEVIEHLEDPAGALGEVARVLRPGGRLVLSTPNRRVTRPVRVPGHLKEFNADELGHLLGEAGFEVLSCQGSTIPYPPAHSMMAWLDRNPLFFAAWRLLNRLLGPIRALRWDLIVLARLAEPRPEAAPRQRCH